MLALPTSSLKEFSQYAKHQLAKGRKISDLATKITLKKATSSTGITYSQAVSSMERSLSSEEKRAIHSCDFTGKHNRRPLPTPGS